MTDMTNGPDPVRIAARAGTLTRLTGAAVSLGLIAGMGVWGYRLAVRDATGIPVVRAMSGPMREAPSNPGGALSVNTGLSVNAVVAVGEAEGPEDTLLLAPTAPDLTEEDMLTMPTAEAGEVVPEGVGIDEGIAAEVTARTIVPDEDGALAEAPAADDTPMTADEMLAFADRISDGVAPMTDLAEGPVATDPDSAVAAALAAVTAEIAAGADAGLPETVPATGAAVASALRPPSRPGTPSAVTRLSAQTAPVQDVTVSTDTIPVGTVLVQLGAFDSAAVAGEEWQALGARFAEFMTGRERVVQTATSGGRAFYRLRAMGFTDIADARRFCSALVAEDAACIPVVVQ